MSAWKKWSKWLKYDQTKWSDEKENDSFHFTSLAADVAVSKMSFKLAYQHAGVQVHIK